MFRILILIVMFCFNLNAQELVSNAPIPKNANIDEDIFKNTKWYFIETDEFKIFALEKEQASYLSNNLFKIKNWALNRWGLVDKKPEIKYTICVVHNKDLMNKMFGLDNSFYEDKTAWLVFDSAPMESLAPALTSLALKDNVPFWAERGISYLNSSTTKIKQNINFVGNLLEKDSEIFFSKSLFESTKQEWLSLSEDKKKIFDTECLILCLMLRKEFGQDNFVNFIKDKTTENGFSKIYKFDKYESFDPVFKRYIKNINEDIKENKIPENYLMINNIK